MLCATTYAPELIAAWHSGSRIERIQQHLQSQSFWLAEQASEVVGFGSLDLAAQRLESLFVSPDAAARGVGRQLLAALESAARSEGLEMLRLDASLNAVDFYGRHGWVQESGTTALRLTSGLTLTGIPMHKLLR